ncbi:DUF2169 domain-containing protein [Candidatus Methylospira mobilis]|uniref:DUF2169 domain-containing protein n=1 Tax=Candidatus Methylospira mobilis TaxID=1808979 RepID=A0A5Q0BN86_9GAMM|nr:DUF2169 domain-containing protein [Candidatus Methylospira mobilis]QFY43567.1 DUF2169 domain-containing protein [Candidatus Methylospira mobilis]
MKVIKEFTHPLFMRPLGLKGNLFLSVAVGCFFDLERPEQIGTEIDMWKLAAETLGKDASLDEGNPKPVGEFLACGRCWSATGAPIASSEVSVRVGNVAKNLYVFGDREWLPAGSETPLSMSQPKPFVSMPLSSERAFGGESYVMNPYGQGLQPTAPFDYWPLPNIETGAFVQSTSDRPEPAGYGMLDFMDPRRYRNMGTYDQRWLENRWPHYPDDFDPCYFNCAAPDQRLDQGYFFPGDEIRVYHMHPGEALLLSHLPLVRQRAFIRQQQGEHLMFVEAALQIDTVWLWPEQLRGLTLARGVFPIADDDADDVELIFTVTESALAAPRSLDKWEQELSERLQRTVPYDLSPLIPGLDEELNASAEKLKAIPDKLRQLKEEIDFDRPSAVSETTAESLLKENLETQAEIDALMQAPAFGTAEQIALHRKILRSRIELSQALREAEAIKSEPTAIMPLADSIVAENKEMEKTLAGIHDQIAGLKQQNPAAYQKALQKLDETKAEMARQAAENPLKGSTVEISATSELPVRPSERLADILNNLQEQKDDLLRQIEKTLDQTESVAATGGSPLKQKLADIEEYMLEVEASRKNIVQANIDKNAMLDQFIEMTDSMTKNLSSNK